MDSVMEVISNSQEPKWLETPVLGGLRVWQIIFLCLAGMTTLTVMICCCFRFRIPRTKQQIEADCQRRIITDKFRQQLETIQDSKMDAMSLTDVLELLHEKNKPHTVTEDVANLDSEHSSTSHQRTTVSLSRFLQTASLDMKRTRDAIMDVLEVLKSKRQNADSVFNQLYAEHPHQPTESETRDAQASSSGGDAFVKFANKVAHLSRLAQPRSPTSPTSPTGNNIMF